MPKLTARSEGLRPVFLAVPNLTAGCAIPKLTAHPEDDSYVFFILRDAAAVLLRAQPIL